MRLLKAAIDPRKAQMNALKKAYIEAAKKLKAWQMKYCDVFSEAERLQAAVDAAEGDLKHAAREYFTEAQRGSHVLFADPELSVSVDVRYGHSTYDPQRLATALKNLDEESSKGLFEIVVNQERLEQLMAEGKVTEDTLREAEIPGERKTSAVTVRYKG